MEGAVLFRGKERYPEVNRSVQPLAPATTEPMTDVEAESPRSLPQTSNIFLRSQDENTTYINKPALFF